MEYFLISYKLVIYITLALGVTLDQLLMFKTVAEVGSLRLASELLHKTQPAISQGIRQLESQFNLLLFSRAGYRLSLTEQGKLLFQRTLRLLNEAAEIQQVAKHLASGHEASITLAFEGSFELSLVLPILELTQNEYPNTQIILKQEYLTGAIEALSAGRADIIISPSELMQEKFSQVETTLLNQGQLIAVAAPKLLARHLSLSSSTELVNEYQIIVQDTGTGTGSLEFGVQDGQRRWYVNDFYTKKMLILSGMGWGKLPNHLMAEELKNGTLQALKLADIQTEILLHYYAIRTKTTILGPVASKLWKNLCLHGQRYHNA
ncbi:MAG: LysR family transcriptional regulator [Methylococcaceae bacterium]|jgi:DNA-binding transcriptional LysR family regulator